MSEKHKFILSGTVVAIAGTALFLHTITGPEFVKIALATIGLHVVSTTVGRRKGR